MNHATLGRNRKLWFVTLVLIILTANFMLYRANLLPNIDTSIVYGSLIDLLIVIPLLGYFLILRKKHSLKFLPLFIAAGYGVAWFIIPNAHLREVPFFHYLIFISEGCFILFELFIAYKIIRIIPNVVKTFRKIDATSQPYWHLRLDDAIQKYMKPSVTSRMFLTEFTLFYYSLFSWKSKRPENTNVYTIHEKTSVIALYIMLIHATVIETIALHYFLHTLNPILSWILLVLNIYGVLYFIAEIQAIRLCPLIIKNNRIFIQIGISKRTIVPLDLIESIQAYNGPEKLTKEEMSYTFDATLIDFIKEKPHYEILLREPLTSHHLYGIKKEYTRILIRLDQPQEFLHAIRNASSFPPGE